MSLDTMNEDTVNRGKGEIYANVCKDNGLEFFLDELHGIEKKGMDFCP